MNEYEQIAAELTAIFGQNKISAKCTIHTGDKGAILHISAKEKGHPHFHFTFLIEEMFLDNKPAYITQVYANVVAHIERAPESSAFISDIYLVPVSEFTNPDAIITITAE